MSKPVRFMFALLIFSPIACAPLQPPTDIPNSNHEVQSLPASGPPLLGEEATNDVQTSPTNESPQPGQETICEIRTLPTSEPPLPNEEATGNESLLFKFSHASSDSQPVVRPAVEIKNLGAISYGDEVESILNRYEVHQWQFNAARGDIITVRVHGSFDTTLELWLNNNRLEANDDGGQLDLSSQIKGYTIPKSDLYTLVVRGFGIAQGKYWLHLLRETFDEETSRMILKSNQTVYGYKDLDEVSTWLYEGKSGEWLLIDYYDGISVFSSNGDLVSPDNLRGNPFRLPTNDRYTLSVQFKYEGVYALWVRKAIDEGDLPIGSLINATDLSSLRSWHFQAVAGEKFTLVGVWDALKNQESLFKGESPVFRIVDSHGEVIVDINESSISYSSLVGTQYSSTFRIPRTDSYTVLLEERVLFLIAKGDYHAPNYLAEIETDKIREFQLYPTQDSLTDRMELKFMVAAGEAGWNYEGDPYVIGSGNNNGWGPWNLSGFEPCEPLRLLFYSFDGLFIAERSITVAEDGTAVVVAQIPQSESSSMEGLELIVVDQNNYIMRYRYWAKSAEPCPDDIHLPTRMIKGYQGTLVKNMLTRYIWDRPLGNPVGEIHEGDTFDVIGDGKCTILFDQDGSNKRFYWWPVKIHGSNSEGWLIEGRNIKSDNALMPDEESLAWARPLFLRNSTK